MIVGDAASKLKRSPSLSAQLRRFVQNFRCHRWRITGQGPPIEAGLHLRGRRANVLQCLFAQDIGIVFTRFCQFDDFVGDGLFDPVVAVSNPQSDADHFEGNTEDALILWVKPFAVEVWADWHGALPCDRRERYKTLGHRCLGPIPLPMMDAA